MEVDTQTRERGDGAAVEDLARRKPLPSTRPPYCDLAKRRPTRLASWRRVEEEWKHADDSLATAAQARESDSSSRLCSITSAAAVLRSEAWRVRRARLASTQIARHSPRVVAVRRAVPADRLDSTATPLGSTRHLPVGRARLGVHNHQAKGPGRKESLVL